MYCVPSKVSITISLPLQEKVPTEIDFFFNFMKQTKHSHSEVREKMKRYVLCRTVKSDGPRMKKAKVQQWVFLSKVFAIT